MKMHLKTLCAASLLAVASFSFAADWAPGATDWDKLPEIKRTKQALYLTPQQAYDMKKKDPKAVRKRYTSAWPPTSTHWFLL